MWQHKLYVTRGSPKRSVAQAIKYNGEASPIFSHAIANFE